jgi:cytochrome c oxidase subunit 4
MSKNKIQSSIPKSSLSSTNGQPIVHKKVRLEGPRTHLVAFALSILLTAFAFLAVSYAIAEDAHVERWFVILLILFLALFQAVVQLAFWMHMKDKGHGIPILGIVMGFFVALTCVVAGTLWSWLY